MICLKSGIRMTNVSKLDKDMNEARKHSLKRGKFYAIKKNFIIGESKCLSARRSCEKINARVLEQFSNLTSLSLRDNHLRWITDDVDSEKWDLYPSGTGKEGPE